MPEMKSVTVRSLRKPGHWWVDNEVLDMFGDDLGCYGIAVYAVLARLCYANSRVSIGQRELAAQARVSQTELRRRLEIMIDLGLLVEHKGSTERSRSSYDLMDVKDLVEQIKAAARERGTAVSSAPPRLRCEEGSAAGPQGAADELRLTNLPISSGDAAQGAQDDLEGIEELEASDLSCGRDTNCAPEAQMGIRAPNGGKKTESAPPQAQICTTLGSDLSLGGANLRQPTARVLIGNTQDTRHKTKSPTPTPPAGRGAEHNPFSHEADEQARRLWTAFIAELKREMCDVPIGVETGKRWKQIRKGQHDFTTCFSAWWLLKAERGTEGALFSTFGDDEAATGAGIAKYNERITGLLRKFFSLREDEPVSFRVLRSAAAQATVETPPDKASNGHIADEAESGSNGETHANGESHNGNPPEAHLWEQAKRELKDTAAKAAKRGSDLEWAKQAVEAARLESVEAGERKPIWRLRSPVPEKTRAAILLFRPSIEKAIGDVHFLVLEAEEGESP